MTWHREGTNFSRILTAGSCGSPIDRFQQAGFMSSTSCHLFLTPVECPGSGSAAAVAYASLVLLRCLPQLHYGWRLSDPATDSGFSPKTAFNAASRFCEGRDRGLSTRTFRPSAEVRILRRFTRAPVFYPSLNPVAQPPQGLIAQLAILPMNHKTVLEGKGTSDLPRTSEGCKGP